MSDDKVNMALDDIIKLNKRKRAGKVGRRNTEVVRQVKGRKTVNIRGRGGFARRRGVPVNVGQRRGSRTRILQRRGVSSPNANVSVVNNAATRRLVKSLVNKALRRMRATSTSSVVDQGAVYADTALTGVSPRSRGIRKRIVEIPSVVVRRPRRVRTVAQPQEEPNQYVYQTVRVVEREPVPAQVVRQRQVRPLYRGVGQRAAVRVVQNGRRAAVVPIRQFSQQRSSQFPIQGNRVFTQQPVRATKALVERDVYRSGNRRQNPRASVVYLNEQMSSRIQTPARSAVRFIKRKPNRQFVAYRDDEFDHFTSSNIGGRGLKRKGRGFGVQYEY